MIIMSTFYIGGCENNNDDAIVYFETHFKVIENIIQFDNDFQESMEVLLSHDSSATVQSEEEYEESLKHIRQSLANLNENITLALNNNIPKMEADKNFQKAYLNLIQSYAAVSKNQYSKMLECFEKDSEDSEEIFNAEYQKASILLDEKIDIFYQASQEFADQFEIEIHWKE